MNLSLGSVFISLIFSIVGISAWRYGKAKASGRHMLLGVALMAYSYFVPNEWASLAVGLGLSLFLFFL
ncbi:MAG: hypothetical protein HQM15_02935 [Deltaproteobacteria bacterium]|nr:hypothetical protein [Deltaproteobacteria bacterium]